MGKKVRRFYDWRILSERIMIGIVVRGQRSLKLHVIWPSILHRTLSRPGVISTDMPLHIPMPCARVATDRTIPLFSHIISPCAKYVLQTIDGAGVTPE